MSDKKALILLIQNRSFEEAKVFCESAKNVDAEFMILYVLVNIALQEIKNGESCIFNISNDVRDWIRHYRILKFYVRRLETSRLGEFAEGLSEYIQEFHVSNTAIITIIRSSTIFSGNVLEKYSFLMANRRTGGKNESE